MAQRKAQYGTLRVYRRPWVCGVFSGKTESSARCALWGPGTPQPRPHSFSMLLNPVTSTPFSVNDILRLEREQIGPEALQLRGARRSPESSQYLLPVPEQRGSEVPSTGSGDGDRRQEGSEPPEDPCEIVTEMDAELVGEPREYALGSRLLQGDQEVGWIITNRLVGGHASPGLPGSEG